jgi:hypothetical protein
MTGNGAARAESARSAKTDIRISTVRSAIDIQTRDFDPHGVIKIIRSGEQSVRARVEAIRKAFHSELARHGEPGRAKKAIAELKKQLPGVLWSGTFTEHQYKAAVTKLEHLEQAGLFNV